MGKWLDDRLAGKPVFRPDWTDEDWDKQPVSILYGTWVQGYSTNPETGEVERAWIKSRDYQGGVGGSYIGPRREAKQPPQEPAKQHQPSSPDEDE